VVKDGLHLSLRGANPYDVILIMPPPLGGGIKQCFCLTSYVCLTSVVYIRNNSRTERPRKTKIGTQVAHVTGHHFQGQRSTCRGVGILWRTRVHG